MEPIESTYGPLKIDEKAFLFFPSKKEEKTEQGKKGCRFFYFGQIQHDDYEKKKMGEFFKYVDEKKIEYNKEFFDEQRILLFLQGNGYKPKEALEAMKNHMQFRKEYLPCDFSRVETLIKKGYFYPCGRDKNFRPIIVFNAPLFDPKDIQTATLATIYTHEEVIKNMFIPGQVENWVIIYDLGGMGVTDIPMSAIKASSQKMSQNYGGRLYKMFVVNAPGTIWFTWKVVSAFLDPITVDKIKISKTNTEKHIFDNIDPSQVQEKYGGKQPNRYNYWPFCVPEGVFDQKRLISMGQYETKLKNGELKRNAINPKFSQNKQ